MAFGIFALIYDELSTKQLSAVLLVMGLIGLYISFYDHKKAEYEHSAVKLTKLCNELRDLYRSAEGCPEVLDDHKKLLNEIEADYYANCISKQILFSDWYAHYKFFWQYQINWIDEQKQFKFFRDKVPLSLMLWIAVLFFAAIAIYTEDIIDFAACLTSN